jgi:hypothetical protein
VVGRAERGVEREEKEESVAGGAGMGEKNALRAATISMQKHACVFAYKAKIPPNYSETLSAFFSGGTLHCRTTYLLSVDSEPIFSVSNTEFEGGGDGHGHGEGPLGVK